MRYSLDTNVVSDLIRNPQGRVAHKIRTIGEDEVCASVIVASELRYGAENKGSSKLAAQLEAVLGALAILPFEPLPTSSMAGYALSWSDRGDRSGGTICSSPLKQSRSR